MINIVAADIGGTHARFAIANVSAGRVLALGPEFVMRTADHASLQIAWQAFATHLGRPLPRAAAIAIACPVTGEVLKLTNNPWVIQPALIGEQLGIDRHALVNDFEAVAHAVAQSPPDQFRHLSGPETALPDLGVITIVGPGTGMGVALLLRTPGDYHVIATEGGHVDFAPVDAMEDALLALLRKTHARVSLERIVSGPGIIAIHAALAGLEGHAVANTDDKALWAAALKGSDSLAAAALDRFCLALGSFAGNTALAQGASGVVIAGGLGLRLADHLPQSGFHKRFTAKGRFESMLAAMPVKIITAPQPGLLGAAAVYARKYPK